MQKSRSLHGILEVLCLGKAKAVKKSFDFGAGQGWTDKGMKIMKVSNGCPGNDVLFIVSLP